ncbi:hypothetical protein ACQCSU_11120 [Pseudarthrobacter sp. O4]
MMHKLRAVLLFIRKPAPRHTTLFNEALLDQKRDDVFIALHQIGLLR